MVQLTKIVALFFVVLLTWLQIGFGHYIGIDDTPGAPSEQGTIPVITNQNPDTYTFADQRQSFQSLIERLYKGLSKIIAPDWFRTNNSIYFDTMESGTAYLATVPLLPYRHEAPLIVFPFHYFW